MMSFVLSDLEIPPLITPDRTGGRAPSGDVYLWDEAFEDWLERHWPVEPLATRERPADEALEPLTLGPRAGEDLAEAYWMAVCRDVPAANYDHHPLTVAAAEELLEGRLRRADDPKAASTRLFRPSTPGATRGPLLSQLLFVGGRCGAVVFTPRHRLPAPGTDWDPRDSAPATGAPSVDAPPAGPPRFVSTLRDLAACVCRTSATHLADAALYALWSLATPMARGFPHAHLGRGQGTLGATALPLVRRVMQRACEDTRAAIEGELALPRPHRPTTLGAIIHRRAELGRLGELPARLSRCAAIPRLGQRRGHYGLPWAFPDAPSLSGRHGQLLVAEAGACITVLKALFLETHPVVGPVAPDADGDGLLPWGTGPLIMGAELTKLGHNVALALCAAGILLRSDAEQALLFGERVAAEVLEELVPVDQEGAAFTFTSLRGAAVRCPALLTAPVMSRPPSTAIKGDRSGPSRAPAPPHPAPRGAAWRASAAP